MPSGSRKQSMCSEGRKGWCSSRTKKRTAGGGRCNDLLNVAGRRQGR